MACLLPNRIEASSSALFVEALPVQWVPRRWQQCLVELNMPSHLIQARLQFAESICLRQSNVEFHVGTKAVAVVAKDVRERAWMFCVKREIVIVAPIWLRCRLEASDGLFRRLLDHFR